MRWRFPCFQRLLRRGIGAGLMDAAIHNREKGKDMAEETYVFSGRVTDQYGKEMVGIQCEAWDKDTLSQHDFLAACKTEADGTYRMECTAARCRWLLVKDHPDVYIVCYSAGNRIASTANSYISNVQPGTTEINVQVCTIYCRVCLDNPEKTEVPAVRLGLRNTATHEVFEGMTSSDGQVAIAVSPGTYDMLVDEYVVPERKIAAGSLKEATDAFVRAHGSVLTVLRCSHATISADPECKDTVQIACQSGDKKLDLKPQNGLEDAVRELAALLPTSSEVTGPMARTGRSGLTDAAGSPKQVVDHALMDVIGRQLRKDDSQAFLASLTRAFTAEQVDGQTQFVWTPRTYAVQSELGAALTGAQASLHHQARIILNDALPLLDGLYPLNPAADQQNVEAVRAIVRTEFIEVVDELGFEGGPRIQRVNRLFEELCIQLGNLERDFGLRPKDINTVGEEQNLTNYLVIRDYIKALEVTWMNFRDKKQTFLGTQLILLSRALSTVAESVKETLHAMDAVYLGPAERQTIRIDFPEGSLLIEDLLSWVAEFAREEGPALIEGAGKRGVESVAGIAGRLNELVVQAPDEDVGHSGFNRQRVQDALGELAAHLLQVKTLADELVAEPSSKSDRDGTADDTVSRLCQWIHDGGRLET